MKDRQTEKTFTDKHKQTEQKFIAQKCPLCNGFGTLKYGSLNCRACNGRGIVVVDNDTGFLVERKTDLHNEN